MLVDLFQVVAKKEPFGLLFKTNEYELFLYYQLLNSIYVILCEHYRIHPGG